MTAPGQVTVTIAATDPQALRDALLALVEPATDQPTLTGAEFGRRPDRWEPR